MTHSIRSPSETLVIKNFGVLLLHKEANSLHERRGNIQAHRPTVEPPVENLDHADEPTGYLSSEFSRKSAATPLSCGKYIGQ